MADELYDRPDLYDVISAPDREMEQFYVGAAGGPDRTVLDLACGTGRLTLSLARSGASVTGGDLSQSMLAKARLNAAAEELAIDFVTLDMRQFELRRRFDTVMIAANSLLHLTTTPELLRCFANVAGHLKPQGRFIFDIFVPSARLLSLPPDQRQSVGTFSHPTLGIIVLQETIAYDPITQISRADWYWSREGEPDFWHTPLHLRQIYPQELTILLERSGFRLINRFGGLDRSPLTASSRRQVVICELAGETADADGVVPSDGPGEA